MIISAKEAQRLTKTRWQAQLQEIENRIKLAIYSNLYEIEYIGKLCVTTIDYLVGIGYKVQVEDNKVIISWYED
jgi:hypothetical protein